MADTDAQAAPQRNELAKPHGNRGGNPARAKKNQPDTEILQQKIELKVSLSSEPLCYNIFNKRPAKCSCLSILHNRPNFCLAVAEWQLMFSKKDSVQQKIVVIDWIRNQPDKKTKSFYIPFFLHTTQLPANYKELRENRICASSMMWLICRGKEWYQDCNKHFKLNRIPEHELTGKPSNKRMRFTQDFDALLEEHFEDLRKEAEPIATRTVRESTGETTLHDTEEKIEFLPPYYTARGCYAKFCLEKFGVTLTTNNKGNYDKGAEDADRPKLPAWSSYQKYWQTNYPLLKVRKPTEDICSFCYKFVNRLRGRSSSALPTDTAAIQEETFFSADEEEEQQTTDVDTATDLTAAVAPTADTLQREQDIIAAREHVRKAREMRNTVNEMITQARMDRLVGKSHSERTYTFVADYCQNLALPHFGKEQPGDTYYYTPTNLFGFGVADVSDIDEDSAESKTSDRLYFHCYKEGTGAKGGNNVASMIMKTLHKLNVLKPDDRGKELNIVMDNCGGQNKNNHVLLLAPYMVEMGFFKKVNMVFLVTGHTKNVCDRRFNNLKKHYHRSHFYSLDHAVGVLDGSKYVTVWKIAPSSDWMDWHTYLLKLYNELRKAKLKVAINHLFTAEQLEEDVTAAATVQESGVGLMSRVLLRFSTRKSTLPEHTAVFGNIINKGLQGEARQGFLKTLPAIIHYKGLPTYKKMMMIKNYLPFVPEEYHGDDLYQEPTEEEKKLEEEDQKRRKAEKKIKKEAMKAAPAAATIVTDPSTAPSSEPLLSLAAGQDI